MKYSNIGIYGKIPVLGIPNHLFYNMNLRRIECFSVMNANHFGIRFAKQPFEIGLPEIFEFGHSLLPP